MGLLNSLKDISMPSFHPWTGDDSGQDQNKTRLNQAGASKKGGSATTATKEQIMSALGVSSDNPNSESIASAVQALMAKGYNLGAATSAITSPNAGAAMGDIMTGNDAFTSFGAGDQYNAAKTALKTASDWESQNQGTTPAQRALNAQITKNATDFQTNMPKLEYSLTAQAAEAQKKLLSTAIEGTQANYNAMGLLYSNAEEGAKNANVRTAAENTTKAAAGINSEVNSENNAIQNNAIQSNATIQAMNQAGTANNTNLTSQYNNISEQAAALQNQALATMGGALGNAAGAGISALNNNAQGGYAPAKSAAGNPLTTTGATNNVDYTPRASGLGAGSMYA